MSFLDSISALGVQLFIPAMYYVTMVDQILQQKPKDQRRCITVMSLGEPVVMAAIRPRLSHWNNVMHLVK